MLTSLKTVYFFTNSYNNYTKNLPIKAKPKNVPDNGGLVHFCALFGLFDRGLGTSVADYGALAFCFLK
jgi:hypothetical protein